MINTSAPADMPTAIAIVELLLLELLGAGELIANASSSEGVAVGFAISNRAVEDDKYETRDVVASDLDDLVGVGSEDVDRVIGFTVPIFDPIENRLIAPTPGQQLLLKSPVQVSKMLQHINPPCPAH